MKYKQKNILVLSLLAIITLLISSCGLHSSKKASIHKLVGGYVVKGVFLEKQDACTIDGLNKNKATHKLEKAGSIKASIDNRGRIAFETTLPNTEFYDIHCDGKFTDERTGKTTEDSITLHSFVSQEQGVNNINLFTDMLHDTIKTAVEDEKVKDDYNKILKNSSQALLKTLGLDPKKAETIQDVSLLDPIHGETDADVTLLQTSLRVVTPSSDCKTIQERIAKSRPTIKYIQGTDKQESELEVAGLRELPPLDATAQKVLQDRVKAIEASKKQKAKSCDQVTTTDGKPSQNDCDQGTTDSEKPSSNGGDQGSTDVMKPSLHDNDQGVYYYDPKTQQPSHPQPSISNGQGVINGGEGSTNGDQGVVHYYQSPQQPPSQQPSSISTGCDQDAQLIQPAQQQEPHKQQPQPQPQQPQPQAPLADVGERVTVRLLVLYTPYAKRKHPDIEHKIDKVTHVLQQTMTNTRTGVTFDIVKAPLSETEVSTGHIQDMGMQADADSISATLHNFKVGNLADNKAKQYQADLVTLVVEARLPGGSDAISDGIGEIGGRFSVINARTLVENEGQVNEFVSPTLAHEIGHNFGLDHDEESLQNAGKTKDKLLFETGIAFVGLQSDQQRLGLLNSGTIQGWPVPLTKDHLDMLLSHGIYRTVMAYSGNSNCLVQTDFDCPAVPYYSTNSAQSNIYLIDVTGGKHRLGDAQHDARSVILKTKKCVSKIYETGDILVLSRSYSNSSKTISCGMNILPLN